MPTRIRDHSRDLHDVVIQRLFATGPQLQTVASLAAGRPELAGRISAAAARPASPRTPPPAYAVPGRVWPAGSTRSS
ncbi:histidine kinase [Catellatospora coxensis]|uniref:histidine kinase n=1 Tax=Catellatospora coxensis TaxID=310354 RepID=UPI0023B2BEEF|nr:histidine kinase [Catellatospora coxensis]